MHDVSSPYDVLLLEFRLSRTSQADENETFLVSLCSCQDKPMVEIDSAVQIVLAGKGLTSVFHVPGRV